MPLSMAAQLGGSNSRLLVQGFDPDDKNLQITEKLFSFAERGHEPKTGLRLDLYAMQKLIADYNASFQSFLNKFQDFFQLETSSGTMIPELPVSIELAGFEAQAALLKNRDLDIERIESAYKNQNPEQRLDPSYTFYLPNIDAGNHIEGLDKRFFALDQFALGFINEEASLKLNGNELSHITEEAPQSLKNIVVVKNLNDCQAGSRSVASVIHENFCNNLHVILGTGANIFIGENFNIHTNQFETEINTEHGHLEPFQINDEKNELSVFEHWRKLENLPNTFEEIFAGGNDDDDKDSPSYHRGIKGFVRYLRRADGFSAPKIFSQLSPLDFPANRNLFSELGIIDNLKSSRILQSRDEDITPKFIEELANKGDALAQAVLILWATRLADAIYKLHAQELTKTNVLSIQGSMGVKTFQNFKPALDSFKQTLYQHTGRSINVELFDPEYGMDGLVELTRKEAQDSLLYRIASAKLCGKKTELDDTDHAIPTTGLM